MTFCDLTIYNDNPLLIRLCTEIDFYRILSGSHRTFATGVACRQGTLTPPDTWSCPIWDLQMFFSWDHWHYHTLQHQFITLSLIWLLSLIWHHRFMILSLIWLLIEFDIIEYRFRRGICNGCGMPTGDAYSSGHLVPSLWDLHMLYLLRAILFRTWRYFTGLCSSNIPRYFLDFALNWLSNVTLNDISVIYLTAHRCTGGLKKKLDLWSGSQSHRHFVWFFNVPVQAPTRDQPFYCRAKGIVGRWGSWIWRWFKSRPGQSIYIPFLVCSLYLCFIYI